MSLTHHKDDLFIAEYTLGLLEPQDIGQAHALLGDDDEAVVCALQWEARLLELTDALTPLHPPTRLLDRIHDTLALPRSKATGAPATPRASAVVAPTTIAPRAVSSSVAASSSAASSSAASSSAASSVAASSMAASSVAASRAVPASTPPAPNAAFTPVSSISSAPSISGAGTSALQSGSDIDFEPRLLRPDNASSTEPSPIKKAHNGLASVQHKSRVSSERNEPSLGAEATATNSKTKAPQRVRTAPPDPTEAFRREAGTRRRARGSFWKDLWFWRLLSTALAVLAIVLILPENTFRHDTAVSASLQPAATLAPTVVQVAVMQAPGTTSTPGWILTVDSRQNVILQPQVDIEVPESESVYLWTYNEQMPQPRLLGVVDPARSLTLPIEVTGAVAPGQIFEMTQEPNLAVPREPEGPILFIGRTVSLG